MVIRKLLTFVKEVRVELGKVSWSSRSELLSSTWVVMVAAILLGAAIGFFDLICTTVVQALLR